jgi:hypothetical protein
LRRPHLQACCQRLAFSQLIPLMCSKLIEAH